MKDNIGKKKFAPAITEKNAPLKEAILNLLESGMPVSHACKEAGTTQDTYYRWMRDDYEFYGKVERLQPIRTQKAVDILYEMIHEKNLGAICFYLPNVAPEKWKNSRGASDVSMNGKVNLKVVYK